MRTESKKLLELFVEKAEQLRSLSYFEGGENIMGFEITEDDGSPQIDFNYPDDEKRDAMLMTLRLFVQNKDDISIGNMATLIDDPAISEEWKTDFKMLRNSLNEYLALVLTEGEKGELSHRDVFEMFLYGQISHARENDMSRKLYKKWVTDETYEILHSSFHDVAFHILITVFNIAMISRAELERK